MLPTSPACPACLSPSATMVSYRRASEMLPGEASSAQYIQVSPVSGMSGVKAILTAVLLPVTCTAGALGLPTDTALLAADSAPGPLSFTVRALRRGLVQGSEVRITMVQLQQLSFCACHSADLAAVAMRCKTPWPPVLTQRRRARGWAPT